MICVCFEPVGRPDARALIVGSMPGTASLAAGEYYAHPRNAFWPILFRCFHAPYSGSYEEKKRLIEENGLALWDTVGSCLREGSLDSGMRGIRPNDFDAFFARYPHIRTVLCNGKTAYDLFSLSGAGGGRTVLRMPSTSPAYTLPYAEKEEIWLKALEQALG